MKKKSNPRKSIAIAIIITVVYIAVLIVDYKIAVYLEENGPVYTDSVLLGSEGLDLSVVPQLVYSDGAVTGTITVTNNGKTVVNISGGAYPINIGVSLTDKDGNVLVTDYRHIPIKEGDLEKGETAEIGVEFTDLSGYEGFSGMRVAYVQEGVGWNEAETETVMFASEPAFSTDSVLLGSEELSLDIVPQLSCIDGNVSGTITVTNKGKTITGINSGKYPVNVGISILDKNGEILLLDYKHIEIKQGDLEQGETAVIEVMFSDLSVYDGFGGMRVAYVQEGIGWNEADGTSVMF